MLPTAVSYVAIPMAYKLRPPACPTLSYHP
ncbi:hypothetical protein FHS42_004572 [Streptomyces zagrosensis]|uniref:Uncharacterized protein n=1 Tax=Streptomyces zagrosensis TaxID=1042984 RepID=A0A7W9QCA2_9ACTN|nr:hypothetical protein [Streptomyces zagrosensis]